MTDIRFCLMCASCGTLIVVGLWKRQEGAILLSHPYYRIGVNGLCILPLTIITVVQNNNNMTVVATVAMMMMMMTSEPSPMIS